MQQNASFYLSKRISAAMVGTIAWFAVVLQATINTGGVINLLSYFTILTNILVAVNLTITLLFPASRAAIFFNSLSVKSAIALYIFIVGLIYNLVLRGLWEPQGMQLLADNLLHVVVPVLYVIYWLLFRPGGKLLWASALYWTIYPLVYLMYSLLRGEYTGWYPYPFLNADQLGYMKVGTNVLMVIAVFFLFALIFTGITRLAKTSKGNK